MLPCRRVRGGLALAACAAFLLAGRPAAQAADPEPGAYCPLPEPGQPSQCLTGAKQTYSDFFRELSEGAVSDAATARLEADVVAAEEPVRTYDALSSLTYGYYLLAHRAVQDPDLEPAVAARLERWNAVLARAYAARESDTRFRSAVREAAADLERRAPPIEMTCTDVTGAPVRCRSSEALWRGLDEARDHSGVRGQISRLLRRLFGSAP